jgi:hypothetical protein
VEAILLSKNEVDTKFKRLGVETKFKRLGVETKFKRLGVETKFKRLGVETKFKRLGVETNPFVSIVVGGRFVKSEPSPMKKFALTVEAFKAVVLMSWLTLMVDALISCVP